MDPVRVGVIGVGHLGFHHARVYTELLNTEVVGIVDTNPERAAAVGELLGVPFFSDIGKFYKYGKPDAVSVVVPTVQHYETARQALSMGTHVLIEKPVTSTVEEAEELLELAAVGNLVLQVGHIERFNSAVQQSGTSSRIPFFSSPRGSGPSVQGSVMLG
jgi:predicted dehydrogenase